MWRHRSYILPIGPLDTPTPLLWLPRDRSLGIDCWLLTQSTISCHRFPPQAKQCPKIAQGTTAKNYWLSLHCAFHSIIWRKKKLVRSFYFLLGFLWVNHRLQSQMLAGPPLENRQKKKNRHSLKKGSKGMRIQLLYTLYTQSV